LNNTTVLFFIS